MVEKMEKLEESKAQGPETKKKDKKRRRQSKGEERISDSKVEEVSAEKETKHKEKEKKSVVDPIASSPPNNNNNNKPKEAKKLANDDKERRRLEKKEERLARRREKEELMQKVPKVDENGIAYTKLQMKRMLKRVKQGLDPVPTEQEERDRMRREAELRREEEAELAGMIYKKENSDDEGEEPKEPEDENSDNDEETDHVDDSDNEEESPTADDMETNQEKSPSDEQEPPKKKSKRAKPVPPDYVCQACKNKHSPAHWIYDCPDKKTVKGINHKKKKERGLHEPDSRKVFVSGLPFDVKIADVQQLFQSCGQVTSCKLIKFGDTSRCNGQAYVTFGTDEAATKALKLSGTTIDNANEEKKTKSKKADAPSPKRRELKLKISRVLNRRLTQTSKKNHSKA